MQEFNSKKYYIDIVNKPLNGILLNFCVDVNFFEYIQN